MRDTEELVAAIAAYFSKPTGTVLSTPWERLTVDEAFRRYAEIAVDDILPDEERFFRTMVEVVQPELGREKPVFLTDWPASMASLAKLKTPATADRFEAFVDGVELCNGFGELTDPAEQRQRFERDQAQRKALGKPVYPIDERFLDALQKGMPPSAGNALGIDRLLMWLTQTTDIRDVVPFPRVRL